MKIINEIIAFWRTDKWSKWVIIVSILFSFMIIDTSGTLSVFNSVWGYIFQKVILVFGTIAFLIGVYYKGIYDSIKKNTWEIIKEVENNNKITFKKEDWENLSNVPTSNLPDSWNKLITDYSIFDKKIEKLIISRTNKKYVIILLIVIISYYLFEPNLHFLSKGNPNLR
jgi:hypothetical protein